jgi:hypothetical protein
MKLVAPSRESGCACTSDATCGALQAAAISAVAPGSLCIAPAARSNAGIQFRLLITPPFCQRRQGNLLLQTLPQYMRSDHPGRQLHMKNALRAIVVQLPHQIIDHLRAGGDAG